MSSSGGSSSSYTAAPFESATSMQGFLSTRKYSARRMSSFETQSAALSPVARCVKPPIIAPGYALRNAVFLILSVMRAFSASEPSGSDEFGSKYTANGFSTGST
jgi:hypothetical protein